MSDTWLTADLHLGHARIIEFCDRPFADADEMNDALITYWNETVAPGDTVWVVGDFAMGKIAETLPLALQLHGRKILVPGNHDRCWPGHDQSVVKLVDWRDKYRDVGFEIRDDGTYASLDDCYVSHFPYTGDSHDEDRYVDMRPVDHGQRLLCGHVHDAWQVRDRMVNVGVDVWGFRPVHLDAALALFPET